MERHRKITLKWIFDLLRRCGLD